MKILEDAIIATLKKKLPTAASTIRTYSVVLDERTDSGISYPAPGILLTGINAEEVPTDIAPWELSCNFGIVIAVKDASAEARHAAGWKLCMQVAQVVYRNTWGISPAYIRPAIISSMQKNEVRDADGAPTGINYWTITFFNWIKFEGLLP